ncbi:allantoicase [Saprolegnia parasitica CBS 223.65]|uniref:Allantoicase n=1 Tax=Saprolegnia parasitica (strain CBS 223.65) TaxID=695850 RepID=A0A067CPH8_SAPPC|nr:allantoicase [Saprolegnia parasitica CBS 223.65]KDO31140.1 allantoicase [Saprolegnia parasitica CBS 223.65]|eukprot:XP_012198268.1 allantoicase [Saprolegnia parasitica CBS 223.65]
MSPPPFTQLTCLSTRGRVLFATDEWFAAADNLLSPAPPVFIADKFTNYGKWMDGWETRRKRIAGHDWCVLELGLRGKIVGIEVDTAFFTGNNAPRVSIQAACLEPGVGADLVRPREMGTCASATEEAAIGALGTDAWRELVPRTELQPGYEASRYHYFNVNSDDVWTHLRVNMFPDGGIARLKVYGVVAVDWDKIAPTASVDLVAAANGGTVVGFSDAHYGHPRNLLQPGRGVNMGDGWETARKKTRPAILTVDARGLLTVPGDDWVVLKLGHVGIVERIEVDTAHFKGNFPESCFIEGCFYEGNNVLSASVTWRPVLPRTKLSADKQHFFSDAERSLEPGRDAINYVRFTMYPDGGISRLRVWGRKAPSGRL